MTKILVTLFFLAFSLHADTVTISAQGVFSADTPDSSFSAPNATWNFAFIASTTPLEVDPDSFVINLSGFQYELSAMMVDISPVEVRVYDDAFGGLFDLTFVPGGGIPRDGFSLSGPSIFSGPTNAPTFLPGTYIPNDSSVVYVAANSFQVQNAIVVVSSSPADTPEPTYGITLGLALIGLITLSVQKEAASRYESPHVRYITARLTKM